MVSRRPVRSAPEDRIRMCRQVRFHTRDRFLRYPQYTSFPPLLSMGFEENSPFVFFFSYIDQKMSLWGMAHEGEVYRDFWGSFRRHGQEKEKKKRFVASYFFCSSCSCRGAHGRPRHPRPTTKRVEKGADAPFSIPRSGGRKERHEILMPVRAGNRQGGYAQTDLPALPVVWQSRGNIIFFEVLGSRGFFQEAPAGVRGRAPRNMRQGQSPS